MAGIVPNEDLPSNILTPQAVSNVVPLSDIPAEVPEDDLPQEHKPVNNSKAFVEGMGRTLTFGATDAMQHGVRSAAEILGSSDPDFWAPSDADVSDRKESLAGKAGEAAGIIGGVTAGAGAPGFIQGFAKEAAPRALSSMGKLGSAALTGAIESGAIQGGDEISKAMLGQGDPEAPVSSALANMGAAGLFGMGQGALFNGIGQGGMKGLAALENAKMGTNAEKVLAGMGLAAKAHAAGIPEKEVETWVNSEFRRFGPEALPKYSDVKPGVALYYNGINNAVNKATDKAIGLTTGAVGSKIGGPMGAIAGYRIGDKYIAPVIEKIMQKPLVGITNKVAIPTIMYALSKGQTSGLFNAVDHATQAAKGFKAIGKGVDAVLKAGNNQALDFVANPKDKQKIIDYIDSGGVDKEMQDSLQPQSPEPEEQSFAKGGKVKQDTWRRPTDSELHQEFKEDANDFFNNKYGGHQGKFTAEDYTKLVKKHGKIVKLSPEQITKTDPVTSKMVDRGVEGNSESSRRIKEAFKTNTKLPHPVVINYGTDENPSYSQVSGRHRIGHAQEHGKDVHVIAIPNEAAKPQHDSGSIAGLYPAQDMMMNAAKGRISNYLSSLKPHENPSKLPFDKDPNLSIEEKGYDDAISLAAAPLSILKHIKDGTIQASQVKNFTSMYPELHQYLSKRFTEGIMNQQLDEEKLPYKTRQALSLFMGTALDSTMSPTSIIAAQSVFIPKQEPQQPQNGKDKKKGSPSKLGKEVKSYKTPEQAAESDRSSRD